MWEKFFESVDEKYVRCIKCGIDNNRLMAKSGNSSNLRRHFVRFHAEDYNEYMRSIDKPPLDEKGTIKPKHTARKVPVEPVKTILDFTCRACLLEDQEGHFTSLLEEPLKTMFFECTSLEVKPNDEVSTVLCSLCVARCDSSKAFRDMAIWNEKSWQEKGIVEECIEVPDSTIVLEKIPTDIGNIEISIRADHREEDEAEIEEIIYLEDGGEIVVGDMKEEILEYQAENDKDIIIATTLKEDCQFCDSSFTNRDMLMLHYQNDHPDNVFECTECNKSFIELEMWNKHSCLNKKHQCNICGVAYGRADRLKAHMEDHLGESKKHVCYICNKAFKLKSNMDHHIKRHGGIKNHQCPLCLATFMERRELARHNILVHSTVRPHSCTECHRAFAFRYMLYRHMRVHTGEKLHTCPYEKCGQKLSSGNALKHHIYTHTGEKPYKCDECVAAFRLKVSLNNHKRDFH